GGDADPPDPGRRRGFDPAGDPPQLPGDGGQRPWPGTCDAPGLVTAPPAAGVAITPRSAPAGRGGPRRCRGRARAPASCAPHDARRSAGRRRYVGGLSGPANAAPVAAPVAWPSDGEPAVDRY